MTSQYSRQLTGSSSSLATAIRTLKIAEKALRNEIDDAAGVITLATITRHLRLAQLINVITGLAALETEMSAYLKNSCKDLQFLDKFSEETMKACMLSVLKETESIHHASDNLPSKSGDQYYTEDSIAIITSSSEVILQKLDTICDMLRPSQKKTPSPSDQLMLFDKVIKRLTVGLPLKYVMSFRHCSERVRQL